MARRGASLSLPERNPLCWRWSGPHGTLTSEMLGDARSRDDMGRCFGAGLTEREVAWLKRTEWAHTAEDILWRRSKLGLRFNARA